MTIKVVTLLITQFVKTLILCSQGVLLSENQTKRCGFICLSNSLGYNYLEDISLL